MRLTEMNFDDGTPVDGYGPGFFRVGGQVYQGPVLVLPGQVLSWGGYGDRDILLTLAGRIDVVFVGTGAEIGPIPKEFRDALEAVGLGVDMMSSPSACRTYNVLLSEGRRVGLALLPV